MKILITLTGPWGTGSFFVAEGVAASLRNAGHEVRLFFPDSGVESHDKADYYQQPERYHIWQFPIANDKVKLDTFPLMIPDPHPRNMTGKTFSHLSDDERDLYFSALRDELTKVIDEFKPDIIECEHIWANDYIVSKIGFPFISVAHNSDQIGFTFDPSMQAICLESTQKAKYIFAISTYVKKQVEELYKVSVDKIIEMPNGYDEEIFSPKQLSKRALTKREVFKQFNLDIPDDAPLVCFVGKLSKTKGTDTLLEAARNFPEDKNIHLLILGVGDINDFLSAEEQAKTYFGRVHLLGHRTPEEVALLNNISRVGVIASTSEGLGLGGIEALACGLPVVSTRCGGPEEYAVGGLVPVGDAKALAAALLKVIDMPEAEYQALSDQSLEKAKDYQWEHITAERVDYYRRAIAKN